MLLDKSIIRQWAVECGFEQCGFAEAKPLVEEGVRLKKWLSAGYNASMTYMSENVEKRIDPALLLSDVKTVVVVLMNYYPAVRQPENQPLIATYAYGNDYHYIVRTGLKQLAQMMAEVKPHNYAVYCDSAPVFERAWAVQAGLGWIGKSGMLVNPHLGTYSFIGVMLTSLVFEPDNPLSNACGVCTRCIDACPTHALSSSSRSFDASKCISYLTIECRDNISDDISEQAGRRLYGCDACLEVCPWNRFAHPTSVEQLYPIDGLFQVDWKNLGRGAFDRMFKFSPMQRAGYKKIKQRANQIMK